MNICKSFNLEINELLSMFQIISIIDQLKLFHLMGNGTQLNTACSSNLFRCVRKDVTQLESLHYYEGLGKL